MTEEGPGFICRQFLRRAGLLYVSGITSQNDAARVKKLLNERECRPYIPDAGLPLIILYILKFILP